VSLCPTISKSQPPVYTFGRIVTRVITFLFHYFVSRLAFRREIERTFFLDLTSVPNTKGPGTVEYPASTNF
jgi:hypothetical protein